MTATKDTQILTALESEESLVACAMIDIQSVDRVASIVDHRDFVDQTLGSVWLLMLDLRESSTGQPDVASIRRLLMEAKLYEKFGGAARIAKMVAAQPNTAFVAFHAKQVRSASHRRKLAAFARQLYSRALDASYATVDTASWASATMDMYSTDPTENVQTIAEAAETALQRIRQAKSQNTSIGRPTGLARLDTVTGGLFPGELTVLAARPGIGKTAFATQIAHSIACDGTPVLQVSLEMEQWEVAIRILAAETGLTVGQFRAAALSEAEIAKAEKAIESMRNIPFVLWRPPKVTAKQVRAKAALMKATSGLSLVVVDYISLIKPEDHRAPRPEQISGITKEFKAMTGELDVPIVLLSQINRHGEGKEPTLADLRESGAVEEDANNVWLLHRNERDSDKAKLVIAKARNGGSGYLEFGFDGRQTRFFDPPVE